MRMPGLGGGGRVRLRRERGLRTRIAVALPTSKWPAASGLTGRDAACATFDPSQLLDVVGRLGVVGWWRWSAGWGWGGLGGSGGSQAPERQR